MSYTLKEFENLELNYGEYATWAIWQYSKDRKKEKLVDCIKENLMFLNNRHVFVGLNISSKIGIWGNFRGGKHDRKLKYALNGSIFRGSYMTDLFKIDVDNSKEKIINSNSSLFYKSLKNNIKLIETNVELFKREMEDIKISSDTVFIILGTDESRTAKLFKRYFKMYFPNNKIIYHRHYSSRGTDKNWVESFLKTYNMDIDFAQIKGKYE